MTELEQYKKAYATLVGRVDTTITQLEEMDHDFANEGIRLTASFAVQTLQNALMEAEEIFLEEE